jgi:hypothetical protein
VNAGTIYTSAHQAYWGFKFLSEKKKKFWQQILDAQRVAAIQEVGRACSQRGSMPKAGYGARGSMTWLANRKVATQVLKAKFHRRYPSSGRPSSVDRRMAFLGVAVGAGVWQLKFSTALRKLAQAGLGPEQLCKEIHRMDRLKETLKSHLWAEPIGNYLVPSSHGRWELMSELPCPVPADWEKGYIIHGYGPNGFQSTFSRNLPQDLLDPPHLLIQSPSTETILSSLHPLETSVPNSVRCRCGAEICAFNRQLALKALAEHKRTVHGSYQSRRSN